ncbi:MAG: hypothetical protein ACOYJR_07490, partial [Acutalibacteraceae bacterium]
IADRVTPAFRFCLVNSTLAYVTPIRYFYFLLLSLIIVSPTAGIRIRVKAACCQFAAFGV